MKRDALIDWLPALVLANLLGLTTPARGADWEVQTVHAAMPNVYPVAPTLVGGPSGSMHLSYVFYGPMSNGVNHAELPFGGAWQLSELFPGKNAGLANTLANTVASDATPHIISYDAGRLRYSWRTGATWTTEFVPNGRNANISPGRAAFNTADGPRFASWDYIQGQLRMLWKDAAGWQTDLHTAMPRYTNSNSRISALMDQADAGTEIHVVYHDGLEPGSLRIARWDGASHWIGNSVVAENVDKRSPFSATLVTTFNVRYVYVAFGRRQTSGYEDLYVTRRPLSAIPNTWNEVALTNVLNLDRRGLAIRAGNNHIAIGYLGFSTARVVLAGTAQGYESMGALEPEDVPVPGRAGYFDMTINNGSLWFAVSTDTLRTLDVARRSLPGGQVYVGGRLEPTTIVYSPLAGTSFLFEGEVGRSYHIEYLDDLSTQLWLPLTNFIYTAPPPPVLIQDAGAVGQGFRFYRARSP